MPFYITGWTQGEMSNDIVSPGFHFMILNHFVFPLWLKDQIYTPAAVFTPSI